MAKIRTKNGYRFIKELGGAVRRGTVSITAKLLVDRGLVRGRVLDYGCGFGFDADHFGWEAFDPYYRQTLPAGEFDTIICNHVAKMLTRESRTLLYEKLRQCVAPTGMVYLSVSRKIPKIGKAGIRQRIQNYVVLTLPSIYVDTELEIYSMNKSDMFEDVTIEFQNRA